MSAPLPGIDEAIARTQIAFAMAHYNIHVDNGEYAKIPLAFTEDATFKVRAFDLKGRAAINEYFNTRFGPKRPNPEQPLALIRHNLTTHFVAFISNSEAVGRTYFTVTSAHGMDHTGIYSDRYSNASGRWLIAQREISVDWYASPSWYETNRLKAGK